MLVMQWSQLLTPQMEDLQRQAYFAVTLVFSDIGFGCKNVLGLTGRPSMLSVCVPAGPLR